MSQQLDAEKDDSSAALGLGSHQGSFMPRPLTTVTDRVRRLIQDHQHGDAYEAVAALLDHRVATGDADLRAASLLLQHYQTVLARLPPLAHFGSVTLRPSDQLYNCFDQFVDLLRQQNQQIAELQAMISELL